MKEGLRAPHKPLKRVGTAGRLVLAAGLAFAGLRGADAAGGRTGDVDCNGRTNSIDAALILQKDAGLISNLACSQAGDVNSDRRKNSIDASLVLQYNAGLFDLPPKPTATNTPTRTPTRTPTFTPTETPTATLEPCTATFDSICIVGNNQEFLDQTSLALTLLRDHAPDHYQNVLTYARKIESLNVFCEINGCNPQIPTTNEVINQTILVNNDKITSYLPDHQDWTSDWYASVIVHEAEHIEAYLNGLPVGGRDGEILAYTRQRLALIEIGAPDFLIDYVTNIISGLSSTSKSTSTS